MNKLPKTLLIGFTTAEADYLSSTYLVTDRLLNKDPGHGWINMKDSILKVIINPNRVNENKVITEMFSQLPNTIAVSYHLMEPDGRFKETIDFVKIRLGLYKLNEELFSELSPFTIEDFIQRKLM